MDPEIPPISVGIPGTPETSPAAVVEQKSPWGFWATVGLGLAIAFAFSLAQGVAMVIYLFSSGSIKPAQAPDVQALISNGAALTTVEWVSAPVGVGLCLLFAGLRKGISLKDYLGLRIPSLKTTAFWVVGFVIYLLVIDFILRPLGTDVSEKFARDLVRTMGPHPILFWLALVVLAPLSEEFFFRGFMFKGLQATRLGGYGAVALTALSFAIIHLHYDLQGMLSILFAGIAFGLARLKTDSIWLCVLLHGLMSSIAMLSVEV